MRRRLTSVLAALFVVSSARADTEACARTLERARELHAQGKLHDAIRAMDACTSCDAIADVCASTKDALVSAVPTLAVTVHDCEGAALADANVFIDGAPVAQGVATQLDPGLHAVRAELAGRSEEHTVIVVEHDKRRASLLLPNPARDRPMPAGAIVLGLGSGALLGASAMLWAWGITPNSPALGGPFSRTGDMNVQKPSHDDLMVAAAITLGAAVATLVTAVVVYVTRPFRTPKRPD